MSSRVTSLDFISKLKWLDGSPLIAHVEPYRRKLFTQALDTFDETTGRPKYNLILAGRAKKNWKSADLIIAAMHACLTGETKSRAAECYLLANDVDQARDDLSLAKALVKANPELRRWLVVKQNRLERRDGAGYIEILPAGDAVGQHGKSYRFCGYDEIHGYRTWDVLEALQPDPTRLDSQQWITSYASIYHKPGVPLFDLVKTGRTGKDPRMLFSWYAADYTTDPDYADATPENRANPSRPSWSDVDYLEQQQQRLPAHKYRRLHLNLPGLPEGSAFQPEPIIDAVERGVVKRPYQPGVDYVAFVDMSGGSSDDAVLAIAHKDANEVGVLDAIVNQGPPPSFDPRHAVERFVPVLSEFHTSSITLDPYGGNTFVSDFESRGIGCTISEKTKSELYEAFEPFLNGHKIALLDAPLVEQQLLGLVWRGAKIDHQSGEHDDWANAAVGALVNALDVSSYNIDLLCGWAEAKSNPSADAVLQLQRSREQAQLRRLRW